MWTSWSSTLTVYHVSLTLLLRCDSRSSHFFIISISKNYKKIKFFSAWLAMALNRHNFIFLISIHVYCDILATNTLVRINRRYENSGRGFFLEQLKIQCYNFNTTKVRIEKCELIARRETGNLLNFIVHYKGLTDLRAHFKLYYRGTSGSYQPYILDFEVNPCDMAKYNTTHKLIKPIIDLCLTFDINLVKGCPLHGPLNMTNFDLDKTTSVFLPPVLPGMKVVSTLWKVNYWIYKISILGC